MTGKAPKTWGQSVFQLTPLATLRALQPDAEHCPGSGPTVAVAAAHTGPFVRRLRTHQTRQLPLAVCSGPGKERSRGQAASPASFGDRGGCPLKASWLYHVHKRSLKDSARIMATPHSGAIRARLRLAGGPRQPLLVNRIEKVTPTEKAQSTLALWATSSNDKGPLALCVKKGRRDSTRSTGPVE